MFSNWNCVNLFSMDLCNLNFKKFNSPYKSSTKVSGSRSPSINQCIVILYDRNFQTKSLNHEFKNNETTILSPPYWASHCKNCKIA